MKSHPVTTFFALSFFSLEKKMPKTDDTVVIEDDTIDKFS